MNPQEDITEKLKKALRLSCDDAFYFSDDETHLIDAEYLLTVNAAKSIQELNIYFGTPYKIYLEHETKLFSTACSPLFCKVPANNFLGYNSIIRPKKNTSRAGKIDVAVYKNNSIDIPICAIEVKGFNPSKFNIQQDLVRNAEYFCMSSETGQSQISFTIFAALHSYKNTTSDKKELTNISKLKTRYDKCLNEINLPNGIQHSIDVFTIRRGTLPDLDNQDTIEMGLQGDEDYHFLGALICFYK